MWVVYCQKLFSNAQNPVQYPGNYYSFVYSQTQHLQNHKTTPNENIKISETKPANCHWPTRSRCGAFYGKKGNFFFNAKFAYLWRQ
jgi:hypothetical protein